MPNTREKLVELLADLDCNAEYCNDCEFAKDIDGCVRRQKEIIADRLIAHGVTVQEWISVKDRLPEEGETVLVFGYWHEKFQPLMCYLSPHRKGEWFTTVAGQQVYTVTHWMPLPQPPKGE